MRLSFLILLFLSVSFFSCDNKFQPPATGVKSDNIPDQESWKAVVTFSDSGKVRAVLNAGHIQMFNFKKITLIDSGAVVDFYRDGEVVSTLSGMRGKIHDESKDIEIFDSVKVVNKEGSILKTSKLYWTNKTQRVSSDAFVKIVTPKEEIEGIGFESDQNLKNYNIYKVTGIFSK